jgi:predicted RND superfamily exporter protein
MKRFIEGWATFVVRFRWWLVILVPIVIVLVSEPAANIYFAHSADMWFLEDDPTLNQYRQLKDRFGDTQYLVVGIEAREDAENIFDPLTMEAVTRIHEFLENHDLVVDVTSLANYQNIVAEEDIIDTSNLIEDPEHVAELLASPAKRQELADILSKEEIALDLLVTRDLKHTVVVAETLFKKSGRTDHHVKLVNDLYTFLDTEGYAEKGIRVHIFGRPFISHQFATGSGKDQGTAYPLIFLVSVVILLFAFRRLSPILATWLVIAGAVSIVFSVQGALLWPISVANASMPFLVIILCIGESMHVIVEYFALRRDGREPKQAAHETITTLWMPSFYTSATTMMGFIGITITKLTPLREYGILAVVGVVATFVLTLTLLPALLSFIRSVPKGGVNRKGGLLPVVLRRVADFSLSNAKLLTVLLTLVTAGSLFLTFQLSFDSNFVNLFKKGSEFRQSFNYFDEQYKGGQTLEFMISAGDRESGVLNTEFLQRVAAFEDYLDSLEQSGKPASILEYLRKLNFALHNNQPEYYRLPSSAALAAQLLLMYENTDPEQDVADYKTIDNQWLRITVRTTNMSAVETQQLIRDIKAKIAKDFPDLEVEITGDLVLFNALDYFIAEGLAMSFSFALVTIALCLFVLFRDVKFTLLALFPSVFPIFFAGAVMELMGIAPDLTTMIIASVTIGIAVDDTIHFLVRYRRARAEGQDIEGSVRSAILHAGNAIFLSTVVLGLGFSVFLLSSMMSSIYFGLFAVIIIVMALVGDLVFLPALMRVFDRDAEQPQHAEGGEPLSAHRAAQ